MSKKKWISGIVFLFVVIVLVAGCAADENAAAKTNSPTNKAVKTETEKHIEADKIKADKAKVKPVEKPTKVDSETVPSISNRYAEKTVNKRTDAVEGFKVPILMYHAIDEYKGNGYKELYVTPGNFQNQMEYLKSAGFTPITFEDLNHLTDINKPILITLDDGYKNNINAYDILKQLSSPSFQSKATIFMIGKKIDTKSGLSKNKLKEMSDSGIISIQSHTETHPSLTTITNFAEELGDIKSKLEKITGKKVNAIAYPSGHYNAEVIEQTKEYYDYAVTTVPGIANTSSSPYEMKRVRINYSTSLSTFKQLVNQ